MTKKINEEIKKSSAFLYGKVVNMTSREANRFAELFKNDEDFKVFHTSVAGSWTINIYSQFCREPKIEVAKFLNENNKSRSKLVMEYEKERKCYLKLKEARHIFGGVVDACLDGWHSRQNEYMSYRAQVIQQVMRTLPAIKPENNS
jgi:hypothetical protein